MKHTRVAAVVLLHTMRIGCVPLKKCNDTVAEPEEERKFTAKAAAGKGAGTPTSEFLFQPIDFVRKRLLNYTPFG